MPKFLIFLGILMILMGLGWKWIGKVPGDIAIETEHVRVYFPIATCLLVSSALSLLFYLGRKFFP